VDAAIKRDTFAVWTVWVSPEDSSVHVQLRHFKADRDDGYIDLLNVKAHILGLNAMYRVKWLTGDPAYMTLLAQELQERGMQWKPYAQSDERMLVASEVLQRVVLDHRLRHGHDAVLEEQLAGTAVRVSDRGVRISKGKSGGMNDAVVGLAMGLAVALEDETDQTEHFFSVLG
jgi:phage terminase large subunit-like protein